MRTLTIITFLSLITLGCNTPPKADTSQVQTAIEARWAQFIKAWEAEDAKGCAAIYSTTGLNIAPDSPVREGRNAIGKFYAFLFNGNLSSQYRHEIQDLEVFQDQVIEYGEFEVDWVRNDSSTWKFRARSMSHWKQNAEGIWELEKFMFNNPPE